MRITAVRWIGWVCLCCAIALLTLVHGCKTRVFDSGTKSSLSPTDVLNVLKNGGLVRLSPDEYKQGDKVAIYFHGRTMKPQPEQFFVELYKNVAPEWQKQGFTLYAYSWVPDSTDPSLQPFDAQDRLWSVVIPKALVDVQSELQGLGAPPAEVRLIGHSLGAQFASRVAWHLTRPEIPEITKVNAKNIRLELIDPIVLCRENCQVPADVRESVQQYSAASSLLPIVYAANLSAIAGFSFESIAHVQEVALEWLGGGTKSSPELQHTELKKTYFASISEPSPRYPDRDGKPGGQAFSAALPTAELKRRVKPTFTKQNARNGLSSRSLATHVYINSALENPNERLVSMGWGKMFDYLIFGEGDDGKTVDQKPDSQPLPLLSEQIARNEIGMQSAQAEGAPSQTEQRLSPAEELRREIEEARRMYAEKDKVDQARTEKGNAPPVQEDGTAGCIRFSTPSDYLKQCRLPLGTNESSNPGSAGWSAGQIREINRCVGLNKTGKGKEAEYKNCWGELSRAFHPDLGDPSDPKAISIRAEAFMLFTYYKKLVRLEFL